MNNLPVNMSNNWTVFLVLTGTMIIVGVAFWVFAWLYDKANPTEDDIY